MNRTKALLWGLLLVIELLLGFKIADLILKGMTMPNDVVFALGCLGMVGLSFLAVTVGPATFQRIVKSLSVVIVAALLFTNCTRIGPGHVGIVINMAGTNKGVEQTPTSTGWTFYNPLSESVIEYPTYIQTAQWSANEQEGRSINDSVNYSSKEGTPIAANISLSYQLTEGQVPHFYVRFKTEDLNSFTHGFVRNVATNCFNAKAANYTVEQLYGDDKTALLIDVGKCISDNKELKDVGFVVTQLGYLAPPALPEQITSAIRDKIAAIQEAQKAENQVQIVRAEAEKNVARAEGNAKAHIAQGQGESKYNEMLSQSLTPQLLEWQRLQLQHRAIDKWNGQRPQVEAGSQGLLLQVAPGVGR